MDQERPTPSKVGTGGFVVPIVVPQVAQTLAQQPQTPPQTVQQPQTPVQQQVQPQAPVQQPQTPQTPAQTPKQGAQTAPIVPQPHRPVAPPLAKVPAIETKEHAQLSTKVPEAYTASNYDELISQIRQYMDADKPMTKEELDKLKRRQRAQGIVAGLSDVAQSIAGLIAAHNYAPNIYNPANSMSAKLQAKWDKEKAERDANADRYINYGAMMAKMQGEDKDRGLRIWELEQRLARQDKDRAEDVAYRDKSYQESVRQWQEAFDRQGEWHEDEIERWQQQFDEGVRQFDVSSANERQRIGLEARRLALATQESQVTFSLGGGYGNVTISKDRLNEETVSRVFSTLPQDVRAQVKGDPYTTKDSAGQPKVEYGPPTVQAMLIAIGAYVGSDDCKETRAALLELAGKKPGRTTAEL